MRTSGRTGRGRSRGGDAATPHGDEREGEDEGAVHGPRADGRPDRAAITGRREHGPRRPPRGRVAMTTARSSDAAISVHGSASRSMRWSAAVSTTARPRTSR